MKIFSIIALLDSKKFCIKVASNFVSNFNTRTCWLKNRKLISHKVNEQIIFHNSFNAKFLPVELHIFCNNPFFKSLFRIIPLV